MSYESDINKTSEKNSLLRIAPLFLVIAIDSIGLGILFPILSAMLISHQSHFLSVDTSNFLRELIYGVTIGIYMIFNPFVVLLDVLPFLGSILGYGIGIMAGIVAFALSLVTIAVAWFAHRPITSLILLTIGVGGFFLYRYLSGQKKEVKPAT